MHRLKPLGVANSGEIEFEDLVTSPLPMRWYWLKLWSAYLKTNLFKFERLNGLSPNNCIKFLDAASQIGNFFLAQVNL